MGCNKDNKHGKCTNGKGTNNAFLVIILYVLLAIILSGLIFY